MHPSEKSSRVVITGASGYLGSQLAKHLQNRGHSLILLSRHKPADEVPGTFVPWDARTLDGEWAQHLEGAHAVVNLAGRTVDCIKTPDHCDEILRSRVEATQVLGQAMRCVSNPPPVWVQMSTAHIVGDPPDVVCDESSPPGYGLAPTVGMAWEAACDEASMPEQRVVKLRTSFVLGRDAGALKQLGRLARLGLGGTVGHGRQGMSWIHIADMLSVFDRAIFDDAMRGVYMATAPNPVSNKAFMRELRRAVGMPIGLPAYTWMVRIGAPLLLRTDPELALYGRYCVPTRLFNDGCTFAFPELKQALADLYT